MPTGEALINEVNEWSAPPGAFAFWWLGQAGVLLKMGRRVVYIDPYLAPAGRRLMPPLLAPEEVTHADLVLCSHDHGDHLDPVAVEGIAAASPQAVFLVPRPALRRLESLGVDPSRTVGLKAEEAYRVGDLAITAVRAKHEFFDRTPEGDDPYLGFLLHWEGRTVYHSGDTLRYEGLRTRLRRQPISVAFLPINGRDGARYRRGCLGNMTYQEAVDLAGESGVRLAVPVHHGMFRDNTEAPSRFVDYLQAKYPAVRTWVGTPGTRVEVPPLAAEPGS